MVAIIRQHDVRAGGQGIENRGHGGHARGEGHCLAAFEPADQRLQRAPARGAAVARVNRLAAEQEIGSRHERRVQRFAGVSRSPGRNQPGFDPKVGLVHLSGPIQSHDSIR
ncbi:MAG: hypothetical protein P8X94_15320 [Woeseiaceae bacterium]